MPLIKGRTGLVAAEPDTPAEARRARARALAQAGDAAGLAAALAAEADAGVREILLTGLIEAGDPAAIVPFLRSEDPALRVGAAGALRILAPATLPLLPALLQDADPDVRIMAMEVALGLPGGAATTMLLPLLAAGDDENVCAAAVEVLSEVGTPAAIPALQGLAARFPGSPFLRFACATAIARLGGAEASGPG